MARYHTVKGLFGQLIHYKDGVRIGESRPSIIKGVYNHYSDDNGYVGHSAPGLFADQIHRDAYGRYAGESWEDNRGNATHYDDYGIAGTSHNSIFGGSNTNIFEDNGIRKSLFDMDNDKDNTGFDW